MKHLTFTKALLTPMLIIFLGTGIGFSHTPDPGLISPTVKILYGPNKAGGNSPPLIITLKSGKYNTAAELYAQEGKPSSFDGFQYNPSAASTLTVTDQNGTTIPFSPATCTDHLNNNYITNKYMIQLWSPCDKMGGQCNTLYCVWAEYKPAE